MNKSVIGSKAYGAAAIAIGLDGLIAGQAAPLLPFGSGISLIAAGMILIFWPALVPLAARLSALIFAAWAIVLKTPLIAAEPASEAAWIGFIGLLALAAVGPRLDAGEDAADANDELPPTPEWRLVQRSLPLSQRGFQASKG